MEISNPFRLGLIGTGRNGNNALVIGFPEWGGRGGPRVTCGGMGTLWELCNKFQPLWWGKCGGLDLRWPLTFGENMGTFAPFSTSAWASCGAIMFKSTKLASGCISPVTAKGERLSSYFSNV